MAQNAVAVHSGSRQGSVSVAELLARDQPLADGANRRTAYRAAAVGGGGAVLLALVATAMTLSGQQPDAQQPAAAMPGPDHISGSSVTLVDSSVAPTGAPDRMQSAAGSRSDEAGDGELAAGAREAGDGELTADNGVAGDGELAADNGVAGDGELAAGSSEPSARTSAPSGGGGGEAAQEAPAQDGAEARGDESPEGDGPLEPVTDLVARVTGPLATS